MKKFCLILTILMVLASECYAGQKVEVESMNEGVTDTAVTVGNTATALPTTALKGRKEIIIYNNSSNTIYIGASSVTTSSGTPILPQGSFNDTITDAIVLYGIASTGSNSVRILEFR